MEWNRNIINVLEIKKLKIGVLLNEQYKKKLSIIKIKSLSSYRN